MYVQCKYNNNMYSINIYVSIFISSIFDHFIACTVHFIIDERSDAWF